MAQCPDVVVGGMSSGLEGALPHGELCPSPVSSIAPCNDSTIP
jgi:hypothetical protein